MIITERRNRIKTFSDKPTIRELRHGTESTITRQNFIDDCLYRKKKY